ncbi:MULTISPECIES: OmpA family protein [Inquilinus]|jgi:outer membrane protein OmpA-like peptidoglycan-associated protein|uniref:Outer membrane protein OmpA-like peptidoglycan-associated protein n=1 Tax=Inquilinus ginsengisoli TaxID=363840 RepID=A0ABU1JFZ0_9PROT|nr:OmpA family protein [Inquilinus ginsengisoli]MDR6287503.1 outer membrane protein OmpA-like peptidoglycan-associated protein [Inquilinus ginsengisoli]
MKKNLMYAAVGAAALLVAAPAMAQQYQATGLYVGAGAGVNFRQEDSVDVRNGSSSGFTGATEGKSKYNVGPAGDIYLGYDWGSIRADAEVSLRNNDIDKGTFNNGVTFKNGNVRTIGIMANAYYDFDFGSPFVPYIGGGVGVALINAELKRGNGGTHFNDFNTQFAYQGIAGVSYNFSPNLAANLEYRYLGNTSPKFKDAGDSLKYDSSNNHTVLVGLRYTFAPAPVVEEVVTTQARSYLVFFDFDSSRLTPEAKQIVASAAADALQGKTTQIGVTGHTDRSGSDRYNQALSVRRAESVRRELVSDGVADSLIVTRGVGEADPLVPTADGVREPQNRRVEIVLQ